MKKVLIYILFSCLLAVTYGQKQLEIDKIYGHSVPVGYKDQSEKLIDGNLTSFWQPWWKGKQDVPRMAEMTLKSLSDIAYVKVYDYQGTGTLKIAYEKNDKWEYVDDYITDQYAKWVSIPISATTQRLLISQEGSGCRISEIEVWGVPFIDHPPPSHEIMLKTLSLGTQKATIELSNLQPETTYDLSINQKPIGRIRTNDVSTSKNKRVVCVSVDGLRADAVAKNITLLPGFKHLVEHGQSSFSARTDPKYTITLPNHVGMVTGRFTIDHGWTDNGSPGNQAVDESVMSIFDLVKKHDGHSALYCTKSKILELFQNSFPISFTQKTSQTQNTASLVESLSGKYANVQLHFIHYGEPDQVGHKNAFTSDVQSPYFSAIQEVDKHLQNIIEAVKDDDLLILTADHGGGSPVANQHYEASSPENYTIPFFIYQKGIEAPQTIPGLIYHTSAANLAAQYLYGENIPGSTIKADAVQGIQTRGLNQASKALPPIQKSSKTKVMDIFIYVILSVCGMLLTSLLDVRKHLTEFRPAIWWRDNKVRLLLAAATLLVITTIAHLAPGIEGFLQNFIEIKTPIVSRIGAVIMAMTVTSLFIVGVKKAEVV